MFGKESLVFLIGILLTILPFLGIPDEWRANIVAFLGVVLIFVGYTLRRMVYLRQIDRGNGERGTNAFVETTEPLWGEDALK